MAYKNLLLLIKSQFLFRSFGHHYAIFAESSKSSQPFFIYKLIVRLKSRILL